jgi:ATP-dependent DNA helicase RecG
MTIKNIDADYFAAFFRKVYGEAPDNEPDRFEQLLENLKLAENGNLNLTGALVFANNPSYRLPAFIVKAVSYPGTDIDVENYLDSRDISGKIETLFHETTAFIGANIRHLQDGQGINSVGQWEIPRIAIEELVVNALVHRDYFRSAPIRIFVYKDRIEIISPGHLPNTLTVENIKHGVSAIRNPLLASFAFKVLPYRGLGSGIRRALLAYPNISFVDDREGNEFKAIIQRRN